MASKNKRNQTTQAQPQTESQPLPTIPVGATVIVSESLPDGGLALSKTVESAIVNVPQNIASVPQNLELPARKPRERYNVDATQFLTVINTSKTKGEAAKKLGMPISAVTSRMQYYRKAKDAAGNKLPVPTFQRGPNRLAIADIAATVNAAIQAANAPTVPAATTTVAPENNVG